VGFLTPIIIGSICLCHCERRSVPRKCALYMGALAAAGCAWSARGDPRYGGKWAWLARRGRCTASSWAQRAVRVDWGLSYTTVQATIARFLIIMSFYWAQKKAICFCFLVRFPIFNSTPVGVRTIAMSVSVCLLVCLSARVSQTTRPNFTQFSACVIRYRGSVLL